MAFMLPGTQMQPPNFQAGGGMPYMANPNAQNMSNALPGAMQQNNMQNMANQLPGAMQQNNQMQTAKNGMMNLSGQAPNFASLPPAGGGYMATQNTGSPNPAPQVNGMGPRVRPIGLSGAMPQFNRYAGVR